MSAIIRGVIYKIESEFLEKILYTVFDRSELTSKTRVYGKEYKFKDDIIDFNCYSSLDNKWSGEEENFLMDVLSINNEIETNEYMKKMMSLLDKTDVIYDFEYSVEDNDRQIVGEEYNRRHLDYEVFMNRYYRD